MKIIIDPPSPFAASEDWELFLKEMEELAKLRPDDPDVRDALAEAREHVVV